MSHKNLTNKKIAVVIAPGFTFMLVISCSTSNDSPSETQ
jgi:hypothetical protein